MPESREKFGNIKAGRLARATRAGFSFSACWLLPAIYCTTAGCADSPREGGYERTERTLRDPMNYHPDFEKRGSNGSGGDGRLDKDGLRKDLDHVLNP